MGKNGFLLFFALFFILLTETSFATIAPLPWINFPSTPRPITIAGSTSIKKCTKSLIRLIGIAGLSLAVSSVSLDELNAHWHGMKHIGGGILLDTDRIENLLSFNERALVARAGESPAINDKIAEMFARKIYGDYDFNVYSRNLTGLREIITPAPRYASEYFKGQSDKRGVCRNKSLILAEILEHYRISASLEMNGVHEWVRVADSTRGERRVLDPTNSTSIEAAAPFYAKNDNPLAVAWPNWVARAFPFLR